MHPLRRILTAVILTAALFGIHTATAQAGDITKDNIAYVSYYDGDGWAAVTGFTATTSTLSIDVVIGTTRGTIPVNPLYFIAKADDGTTYITSEHGTLDSFDLPAGERAKGTVTFDYSGGPRPTIIALDGPLDERLASWTINWATWKPAPQPVLTPFGSSA